MKIGGMEMNCYYRVWLDWSNVNGKRKLELLLQTVDLIEALDRLKKECLFRDEFIKPDFQPYMDMVQA